MVLNMDFETIKVAGTDAVRKLIELRSLYPGSGYYPFLIGGADALDRHKNSVEIVRMEPSTIVHASMSLTIASWIAGQERLEKEYGFTLEQVLGEWPGEIAEKGSIGLHRDVLSGRIKSEAYIGLARIESPWQLPAAARFGAWNECPEPQVHCTFQREWQAKFGSEITGMSGDIVECAIKNPPTDQEAAMNLAIEQYWYCRDIVDQGCGTIAKLGAILLNSPYWYFWWD